jgi:hypothetical protein
LTIQGDSQSTGIHSDDRKSSLDSNLQSTDLNSAICATQREAGGAAGSAGAGTVLMNATIASIWAG